MQTQRGFTLIELLAVVLIIATLASMAVLSLGATASRGWANETERLRRVMELVADRALIDNQNYGVAISETGYTVVIFDRSAERWIDFPSVAFLAAEAGSEPGNVREIFLPYSVPPNISLDVISKAQLLPGNRDDEDEEAARDEEEEENSLPAYTPDFVALASGEVLPVEVSVQLLDSGNATSSAVVTYNNLTGFLISWGDVDAR
ncbi:type II secretion system protein [Biformimicrobium ophioploci]|uniref:Type II secretion system protein H n=1 Tax=Biformimicrobium ophioploci TaxID=3036711 RepID=A0ABQ6M1K9_9GAMM|nr:prepilin-type N-terminal cleavage/methylation domain-containing protein [Microbulbifer sp. NKW57]GMG88239.1 hypothetical protein MNKW57_25600 [Microbulbifer sp. NKW57]